MANFFQAAARPSFCSPFEFQPGVHTFSSEPSGWLSTAQDAFPPARFQHTENRPESGPDVTRWAAMRKAPLRMLLQTWHAWMLLLLHGQCPGNRKISSRMHEGPSDRETRSAEMFDRETLSAETKPGRQKGSSRNNCR